MYLSETMSIWSVIISAGGIGRRMGGDIPKQFHLIHNKPIILHTIEKFLAFDAEIELIIVLPEDWINYWEELCQKFFFTANHKVVVGGDERFFSIQNGLREVTKPYVAVHDAVRPVISAQLIRTCFDTAIETGTAIPVVPINESLIKIENEISVVVNREDYRIVQTPQCFKTDLLKEAYQQLYSRLFTDDASVFEAHGGNVSLVQGEVENIKITRPADLKISAAYLE